jgi:hypothetical protein
MFRAVSGEIMDETITPVLGLMIIVTSRAIFAMNSFHP